MQKTEQRAFATSDPTPDARMETARHPAPRCRFPGDHTAAPHPGWRIRPVLIRVEDEGEGR